MAVISFIIQGPSVWRSPQTDLNRGLFRWGVFRFRFYCRNFFFDGSYFRILGAVLNRIFGWRLFNLLKSR
jgi:hypothetical protein